MTVEDVCMRIQDYICRESARERDLSAQAIVRQLQQLTRQEQQETLAWLGAVHPDIHAMVQALRPPAPRLVVTYTTAPVAYDGFGTETLAVVGTLKGKEVRKVDTPEQHVEWQRQRYGSGLHYALSQAQFDDLIQYAFAGWVPTEEA
jgi:hypothetical protein